VRTFFTYSSLEMSGDSHSKPGASFHSLIIRQCRQAAKHELITSPYPCPTSAPIFTERSWIYVRFDKTRSRAFLS